MQALNIAIDEVSEFKLFMQRAKAGQDRLAEKLDPNLQPGNRAELIKSLLQRWEAGRADILAHYNPDLTKGGAA